MTETDFRENDMSLSKKFDLSNHMDDALFRYIQGGAILLFMGILFLVYPSIILEPGWILYVFLIGPVIILSGVMEQYCSKIGMALSIVALIGLTLYSAFSSIHYDFRELRLLVLIVGLLYSVYFIYGIVTINNAEEDKRHREAIKRRGAPPEKKAVQGKRPAVRKPPLR